MNRLSIKHFTKNVNIKSYQTIVKIVGSTLIQGK